MKRRSISPFSLSFLDIMFCGFGAVVLLVLILNTDTVMSRNEVFADLRADVMRLENEVIVGKENRVEAFNSLEATDEEIVLLQGESERVIASLREIAEGLTDLQQANSARRAHINRLQSDLKGLDSKTRDLAAEELAAKQQGEKVHQFIGEGDRQYLTGLKLGGRRTLILVDASASMLAETIVNVIRLRNMAAAQQRQAQKWQRTVAVSEWLLSNIAVDRSFQLYTFNTRAVPVVPRSAGKWLSTGKAEDIAAAVRALRQVVPGDGTSLYQAFAAAANMQPKPDNIILITDGLPTQGKRKPSGTTVSSDQRLDHFRKAWKVLPGNIPVNTILMPMEGDAYAAAAFWNLAVDTSGAFLTPARDWP